MMGMCQIQCMECVLCGNIIDDEVKHDNDVEIGLFGAVAYAVCPICHSTGMPKDDPVWRKKVNEWVKNHD